MRGQGLAYTSSGVKVGTYVGKVAVRGAGSFNIATPTRTVQGISHRFRTVLHHCDGYRYQRGVVALILLSEIWQEYLRHGF